MAWAYRCQTLIASASYYNLKMLLSLLPSRAMHRSSPFMLEQNYCARKREKVKVFTAFNRQRERFLGMSFLQHVIIILTFFWDVQKHTNILLLGITITRQSALKTDTPQFLSYLVCIFALLYQLTFSSTPLYPSPLLPTYTPTPIDFHCDLSIFTSVFFFLSYENSVGITNIARRNPFSGSRQRRKTSGKIKRRPWLARGALHHLTPIG